MSERQAKLKRKNEVVDAPVKKKSALDIVSNIVIVVLILAVLGIGGWAVYSKYSQMPSSNEAITPTISEYAETQGITAEEFIEAYGLNGVAEITSDSLVTDAMLYMTLGNYATFAGADVEEVREGMGIGDQYTDDTLMSVILEDLEAAQNAEAGNVETEVQE